MSIDSNLIVAPIRIIVRNGGVLAEVTQPSCKLGPGNLHK